MSNTTTTKYAPGSSAKARENNFGEQEMRLSFKIKDFGPWVKENTNEAGFINLIVSPRKEVGPWGDTHSIKLDTFVPKPREEVVETKANSAPKKATAKTAPKQEAADDQDIPF